MLGVSGSSRSFFGSSLIEESDKVEAAGVAAVAVGEPLTLELLDSVGGWLGVSAPSIPPFCKAMLPKYVAEELI